MQDPGIEPVDPDRAYVVSVASRLKAAKEASGITVRDLAAAAQVGVSTVDRYLNATRIDDMKLGEVRRLCRALGISYKLLLADASEGDS